MPDWLKGDVLDVRKTVNYYLTLQEVGASAVAARQQQYVAFPRVSVSSSPVLSASIRLCSTASKHHVYKARNNQQICAVDRHIRGLLQSL